MKKFILTAVLCSFVILNGCTGQNNTSEIENITESEATTMVQNIGYEQITGAEAKQLMDTESDYIIIDARTTDEFNEGHIDGAILIPEYEIAERAEAELPQKDRLILVYCRSGRRSKIAAQALADLGYTNVKEFGGIIDWQYDIVR